MTRLLIANLVFAWFAVELLCLLRRGDDPLALVVLFATLGSVTVGEWMNLAVSGATSYPGCPGFPLYIILGGGLLGLWLFRSARFLAGRTGGDRPLPRLLLGLALTPLFPFLEIAGIRLGLWAWNNPINPLSPGWLIGIWLFYSLFIGTPALLALLLAAGTRPALTTVPSTSTPH